MNLCEPNACHIVSYSLIIKHLATLDVLFVRVSRFEHTALNIYSDTIEDVAVGIVYFPGLDGCEIYLRGVLGVVAHCLTDDANGDVFLLGCRGPRMARNIHGERNGDACHDAYLLEVALTRSMALRYWLRSVPSSRTMTGRRYCVEEGL